MNNLNQPAARPFLSGLGLAFLLLALSLGLSGLAQAQDSPQGQDFGLGFRPVAPVVKVTIEKAVERPQEMFTQGLIFYNQHLYESTGLYNKSALHSYPAAELEQKGGLGTQAQLNLPPEVFAEGLAQANGILYLLTWNEGLVYLVDPSSLEIKKTIHQAMEGWGLAYDGQTFWRSDGSDRLQKHQVENFAPTGEPLQVRDGQNPVRHLNELEWEAKSGLILANIWHSALVAAIDPASGLVKYY
ncbi:MAG: glutaminyl-peptide cyclotransferase, partial [Deltaproteobacteria bacterium]|nr:glutaminyl-peptide cyclotransferase [Deltaproteobacteria bacterium]